MLVSRLMLEPPARLPPDLVTSMEVEELRITADRGRYGAFALFALLALGGMLPWAHVTSWPMVVLSQATIATLATLASIGYRRHRPFLPSLTTALGVLLALEFARVSGPFMLTPIIGCGVLMALSANPWFDRRVWLVIVAMLAITLGPVALEAADWLAPTWGVGDGIVWVRSAVYEVHPGFGGFSLILANAVLAVALAVLAHAIHRRRRLAQRTIHIQAWHLHQLLPTQR